MRNQRRNGAARRSGRLAPRGEFVSPSPLERLEPRVLMAATYYVAPTGSDSGAGSLAQPLKTIQAAADRAAAGDTVLIRAGVYRETVTVPRSGTASSPITFRPYNGESVTVSGADPVAGWSLHSGSVYRAAQGWDRGAGNNQVFVDGRMMVEARWPNTTLDLSRPRRDAADNIVATYAGDASYATLTDDELSGFAAGAWNGATVHISSGQNWVTQSGKVTSSAPGRLTFDYVQRLNPKSGRFETPETGDPYFLTGKFVALDAAGEWFLDAGTDQLYLWTPAGDSPAGHTVEVKRREHAFDLSGRSNVTVEGLRLFAANIVTDAASSGVVIDGIGAEYVGHFSDSETGWEVPIDSGIYLAGTDSVIRNSTIAFGAGHGIGMGGSRNRIENNVIHDVGYSGANGAGIRAAGTAHFIRNNTVYNVGRSGILVSKFSAGRILNNLVHDVMLQNTDGGGIYTFGTDGQGAEIAYNRVYNVNTGNFGGVGVYLDNGSTNFVVHHNLTYNVTHGTKMNPPGPYNQVFNNTFVANNKSLASSGTRDMPGSAFRNNIFTRTTEIGPGATQEANLFSSTAPQFVNPGAGDYRLQATSPAVDRGVTMSAYTEGYTGAAPDAGAFEYGKAAWVAGASASLRVPDSAAPSAPRNLSASVRAAGVLLDWSDGLDPDRVGYHVYRAASASGPFARLTDLAVGVSYFLDPGAPLDAVSHYRVVALDSSGNLSVGATAAATLRLPAALPAAPLTPVVAPASANHIDLSWAASPDVFGYRVERMGPGESAFREVARTQGVSFRDSNLSPAGTYTYRVRSENLRGVSPPGAAVATSPLRAPAGLSLKVVSGTRSDLAWSDVAGETAYYVQRSRDGNSGWLDVGYAVADVTTFSDVSVPTGAEYHYRVLALGGAGFSPPSNVVATKAPAVPVETAYSSADIASTPAGATTVVAADTAFDVVAGGRNIFGTSDGFRFVYRAVTGDFDARVRLTGLAAVVSTTKAGLMAREGLAADGRNVFSHATASSGELRYSRRLATGGETTLTGSGVKGAYPNVWLRLRRAGNVFTAFGSTDGTNWVQTGSDSLSVGGTVFVGMAVSAQSTTQTTTAKFRELSVQGAPAPVAPAAPKTLTPAAASPTRIDLSWTPSAGATHYRVERRGPGESAFAQVASGVAGAAYADKSVLPESTYAYRVRAENAAGLSAYSPTASATTPKRVVAGAFTGVDVGGPAPAGSTVVVEDGRAYDVTAGGTDVAGATDRFHFAHQQRSGDFDVKVRVQSLTRAHDWTKAGLMARASLSGNSRNAFVTATPDVKGHRFTTRLSDGGSTVASGVGPVNYPGTWLRLRRRGNTFSGFRSTDGVNWTLVGSRNVTMGQTVYFGMAVTSHDPSATATARFRDLADVGA